jgi:TonB family protein
MKLRGVALLACVLAFARGANANVVDERRAFAQELAKDVAQRGLQKLYVPDFTDESGRPFVLGRFFAATFAQMLGENAKGFVVLDRVDVHRYLSKSERKGQNLTDPDVFAKLVSDMGPDGILWGKVSVNQDLATIDVVMRNLSGKELAQRRYEEKLDAGLRADLEASQSGGIFYYAGLDGVSLPKCLYCPAPYWPVGQGSPGREGDVVLSVVVTLEGKADQMLVIQTLDPVFDRAALEAVRSWRFEPSKDADGKSVPVRLPVQVTFKRSWKVR